MAIIKSLTLDSGIVLDQAYIRVHGVNTNRTNDSTENKLIASINLAVFISQEAANDLSIVPIHYLNITFFPSDEENSLRWDKQAYEYVKTLEDFAGAIDV